jgi:hypothetical protein
MEWVDISLVDSIKYNSYVTYRIGKGLIRNWSIVSPVFAFRMRACVPEVRRTICTYKCLQAKKALALHSQTVRYSMPDLIPRKLIKYSKIQLEKACTCADLKLSQNLCLCLCRLCINALQCQTSNFKQSYSWNKNNHYAVSHYCHTSTLHQK